MLRRVTAIAIAASSITLVGCPSGTSNAPAGDLLALVNQKRMAAGCNAVLGSEQLRMAAERHAVDIRDHPGHFGAPGSPPLNDIHVGTDSSSPATRIDAAGYSPRTASGEIVYTAAGPPDNTPQATIDWWMNSPTHRNIIQDCGYEHAGVGLLYPGGVAWIAVVDFGAH